MSGDSRREKCSPVSTEQLIGLGLAGLGVLSILLAMLAPAVAIAVVPSLTGLVQLWLTLQYTFSHRRKPGPPKQP